MFKRKKCGNCGEKIGNDHRFCPGCGVQIKEDSKKEEGMLGKRDSPDEENELDMLTRSLLGNMNKGVLGKMLGSAMKMLEKELQKMEDDPEMKKNFQLFINGKKVDPNKIKVQQETPKNYSQKKSEPKKALSKDKIKRLTKLPKQEPSTNMKRFSDSLVYELDVPGVESVEDIMVSKLESSIEIKALARDKVYSKLIPINLPIKNYTLDKNKLVLQLDANNN